MFLSKVIYRGYLVHNVFKDIITDAVGKKNVSDKLSDSRLVVTKGDL